MIATKNFKKHASSVGGIWWTSDLPSRDLLRILRRVDPDKGRIKAADIGGEQEQGFEQAFSSLAYSYIKDKSPRLIDFMIGFQLVDRNEDNTKAVGIFGFKVDKQWLYCPVFFLNGDLKGHELLYIVNSDTFVPMKENWVNYLISRKPHVLGSPSSKNTQQMGGMWPNLMRLVYPPSMSKYGSSVELPEWVRGVLPMVAAAATKQEKFLNKNATALRMDLEGFLSSHSEHLQYAFKIAQAYPLIRDGFERFHGKDFFVRVGKQMLEKESSLVKSAYSATPQDEIVRQIAFDDAFSGKRKKKPKSLLGDRAVEKKAVVHPLFSGKLKIAVMDEETFKDVNELSDEDREKLINDTILIKDKRDPHENSVVYNTQVKMSLINPSETGLYDVLEKPGKFSRMLVINHPKSNCGKKDFATVVRTDSPKNWINIHAANLWVEPNGSPEKETFMTWFNKLPDKSTIEVKGTYIVIGPRGDATTPFRVKEKIDDNQYRVNFDDYTGYSLGKPSNLPKTIEDYGHSSSVGMTSDNYHSSYNALLYFKDAEGCSLRNLAGELHVPKEFKVIKLKDPPAPPKEKSLTDCDCSYPEMDRGSSEEKPITPGNMRDVQLMLFQKTASLKVIKDNNDWYIKTDSESKRLSKKAALIRLVGFHGATEETAREICKEVEKKGSVNYRIKHAAGFGPNASSLEAGDFSPAIPAPWLGSEQIGYGSVNSSYPQEEFEPVNALSSYNTDTRIYDPFHMPDKQTMQVAQEASRSGQREIFDTVMISSMLKSVRQDNLIDKHLGDLMKALDKLGRILFMFYWHQEEFEDRFGRDDLPELEDSIRNAFEVLGDVVLFLKQKSVSKLDEFGGVGNAEPSIEEAARN